VNRKSSSTENAAKDRYILLINTFVNCSCVDTRWQ